MSTKCIAKSFLFAINVTVLSTFWSKITAERDGASHKVAASAYLQSCSLALYAMGQFADKHLQKIYTAIKTLTASQKYCWAKGLPGPTPF